jgi:uncharacterized protein HemX
VKKITFVLALAVATAAWGQQKEAAKSEAATVEPPKVEAPKVQKKKAAVANKTKRQQDARHCLQRGDNTAIIKCAEEYL